MARQFANNAESTLASGIASGATSLTVAAGHGARFPATGDFTVRLQDATDASIFELVTCTARSTDTLTITATTSAWDAADKVFHVVAKADLDAFLQKNYLATPVVRTNATDTSYTLTGATWTDIDATNLAITFTAPSSGRVRLMVEGLLSGDTVGGFTFLGLRSGTTNVAGTPKRVYQAAVANNRVRIFVPFDVSGLTPGTSYTYKLGWRGDAPVTSTLWYGPDDGNGPITMTVEEVRT